MTIVDVLTIPAYSIPASAAGVSLMYRLSLAGTRAHLLIPFLGNLLQNV